MSETSEEFTNETETNPEVRIQVYAAQKRDGIFSILKSFAQTFSASHALGFLFAKRNIVSKYRQSFLGIFWAFIPPIATACVWMILYQSKVVKLSNVGAPYPVFVITGTILWSVFTNSVLTPLQTIQSNRSILVKINFPREALLISAFYEILFNSSIALLIVAGELLLFRVHIDIHALLIIPCIFLLMFLGISVGLLLLPFSLLYRDIQLALPSVLQFAMYLTPVVYARPMYEGAGKILALNPVSPILTSARSWLLGIPFSTPLWHIGLVAGCAFVLFIIGIVLYRMTLSILIERMGT